MSVTSWIEGGWQRWQFRRWQRQEQCRQAAQLSDQGVAYYAAGYGNSEVFAAVCRAEARRRGLKVPADA